MSIRDKLNRIKDQKGVAVGKPAIQKPKFQTPSLEPPIETPETQSRKPTVAPDETNSVIRSIDELYEKTDAESDPGPKTLSSGNLETIDDEVPAAEPSTPSKKITVSHDVAKFLKSPEGKKAIPDEVSDENQEDEKLDPEINPSVVSQIWVHTQIPNQMTNIRDEYSLMYVGIEGGSVRTFVLYEGLEQKNDVTIEQFRLIYGKKKIFPKLPTKHGPIHVAIAYNEDWEVLAKVTGGKDKLLRARDGLKKSKQKLVDALKTNMGELTFMTVATTSAALGISTGISIFGHPLLESIGLGVGAAVTDVLLLLSMYFKSRNL